MKISVVDDNIIVFLNKYISNIDYNDSKELEKFIKKIIDKLDNYGVIKKGYYDTHIYVDNDYGIIIELSKDSLDYMDLDDVIDMKITISKVKLLYKINDIYDGKIYLYKNSLYLDPINIDINLYEHSEIIYKNVDEIRKFGRILKSML